MDKGFFAVNYLKGLKTLPKIIIDFDDDWTQLNNKRVAIAKAFPQIQYIPIQIFRQTEFLSADLYAATDQVKAMLDQLEFDDEEAVDVLPSELTTYRKDSTASTESLVVSVAERLSPSDLATTRSPLSPTSQTPTPCVASQLSTEKSATTTASRDQDPTFVMVPTRKQIPVIRVEVPANALDICFDWMRQGAKKAAQAVEEATKAAEKTMRNISSH